MYKNLCFYWTQIDFSPKQYYIMTTITSQLHILDIISNLEILMGIFFQEPSMIPKSQEAQVGVVFA
jgi:hypothetical protein